MIEHVENLLTAVDSGNLADALRALVAASNQLGSQAVTIVPDDEKDSDSVHVSNGDFGFTLHGNGAMTHLGG